MLQLNIPIIKQDSLRWALERRKKFHCSELLTRSSSTTSTTSCFSFNIDCRSLHFVLGYNIYATVNIFDNDKIHRHSWIPSQLLTSVRLPVKVPTMRQDVTSGFIQTDLPCSSELQIRVAKLSGFRGHSTLATASNAVDGQSNLPLARRVISPGHASANQEKSRGEFIVHRRSFVIFNIVIVIVFAIAFGIAIDIATIIGIVFSLTLRTSLLSSSSKPSSPSSSL